jgi:metallo-beta-lactamase family protein
MCEVGRVLHHLKSTVENAANTVLMVGHSAPNTLGRRITDGASEVKIFGEEYRLRAEVAAIDALSAHADSAELIDYVKKANGSRHGSIKGLYLVHGEEEQSLGLARRLKDVVSGEIVVPTPGEVATA